jgi:hypothetical protein
MRVTSFIGTFPEAEALLLNRSALFRVEPIWRRVETLPRATPMILQPTAQIEFDVPEFLPVRTETTPRIPPDACHEAQVRSLQDYSRGVGRIPTREAALLAAQSRSAKQAGPSGMARIAQRLR